MKAENNLHPIWHPKFESVYDACMKYGNHSIENAEIILKMALDSPNNEVLINNLDFENLYLGTKG
jgi:hypothetical protein